MTRKLYYLGKPADGYGWGVANTNLIRELGKLCEVQVVTSDRNRFDAPVFMPVADYGLKPDRPVKATRLLGYGFWEFGLDAVRAKINAERYDWIFAGSEWCAARVRSASGSSNVSALIQGVDFNVFTPQPWPEKRNGFRVFSGGKYEFRKAQDIVLAAMKVFMGQRKDVVLVTSWNNPWPETTKTMEQSWLIEPSKPFDGIDEKRVINLTSLPNAKMPAVYCECDCGLFPNRCEAGTNLVMCEMMACSRPVIGAEATGQGEVLAGYPLNLKQGSFDNANWFNANVSDCLVQLEKLYQNRALCAPLGARARQMIEPYTWQGCAQQIVSRAFG
jgi:glycosyltransferase involved in cell wall biosynthesis